MLNSTGFAPLSSVDLIRSISFSRRNDFREVSGLADPALIAFTI
jgi:hypothetical protein